MVTIGPAEQPLGVDLLAFGADTEVREPVEDRPCLVVDRSLFARRDVALNELHVGPVGRNIVHAVAFACVAIPARQSNFLSHNPSPFVNKGTANLRRKPMHATGFEAQYNCRSKSSDSEAAQRCGRRERKDMCLTNRVAQS